MGWPRPNDPMDPRPAPSRRLACDRTSSRRGVAHASLWLGACLLLSRGVAAAPTAPAAPEAGEATPETGGDAGGATPSPGSAPEEPGSREKRNRLSDALARQGEADLQRSVRVFQQRYLLKGGRVEVLAGGSASLGDPMMGHLSVDAGLLVHLNEHWAVGLSGSKPFGSENETFLSIQRDFGLFPERSLLQATGFAEVQFSPIFGKVSSFGVAVEQMDIYGVLGAGGVRTTATASIKPAGQIGVGMRLHLLRALTLSFEVRDTLMMESFQAGDRFMQHVFGGAKLGFWIPPTVEYRYQR